MHHRGTLRGYGRLARNDRPRQRNGVPASRSRTNPPASSAIGRLPSRLGLPATTQASPRRRPAPAIDCPLIPANGYFLLRQSQTGLGGSDGYGAAGFIKPASRGLWGSEKTIR